MDRNIISDARNWQVLTYQISAVIQLTKLICEHPSARRVLGVDNINAIKRANERLCVAQEHLSARMCAFGVAKSQNALERWRRLSKRAEQKTKLFLDGVYFASHGSNTSARDWHEIGGGLTFAVAMLEQMSESEQTQTLLKTVQRRTTLLSAIDRIQAVREDADYWMSVVEAKDYSESVFLGGQTKDMREQVCSFLSYLADDATKKKQAVRAA